MAKKALLVILDGWGINKDPKVSAIEKANTPFYDEILAKYPNTTLSTFGNHVGLPDGQMGNSEVGHMHIGAGRVVYQNLEKINRECKNGLLEENPVLQQIINYCQKNNKALHLLGLVSDGGVHSHIQHLFALIDALKDKNLKNVFIHAITDGRDCDPKSGLKFISDVENKINNLPNFQLTSVVGRYFAMDRDKRWERVKVAYDLLTQGKGQDSNSFTDSIKKSYENKVTDEFLQPLWNQNISKAEASIKDGDAVLFFNFRTDRGRELTEVLCQNSKPDFGMKALDLHFATMTNYDDSFENISVLYENHILQNTMGEVLEKHKKTQLRIAETEKYPHVTFFFSGGRENTFVGEDRILCPSPKEVATYDLKPEMAAFDIKNNLLNFWQTSTPDFICLNFANPDMVGHTGSMEAATKACEAVDKCLEEICNKALEKDYGVFIIADHGNADVMINPDGSPNTQHSTNPVPFVFLDNKNDVSLQQGGLADIAPTILVYLNIEIPKEMTGKVLFKDKK